MGQNKFVLRDDYYETTVNGVTVRIKRKNYNENTVAFALKVVNLYQEKKTDVIDFIIAKTAVFYEDLFSTEDLKEKLHEPQIKVFDEKFGELIWLYHQLDEHIIVCEFMNDLKLYNCIVDG